MAVSVSWIARRWCIVEQDEQRDLFVQDPWHLHLVDINLRLDVPRERTLCGDLLPSRPMMAAICPACMRLVNELRQGQQHSRPVAQKAPLGESGQVAMTIFLAGVDA